MFNIFLIFAQNIAFVYTLEPPWRGGSYVFPQAMFWIKNKKSRYAPANPSFTKQMWGMRGYVSLRYRWTCFPDDVRVFVNTYIHVKYYGKREAF